MSLATAVLDPRYVRVDGAALLLADATARPERCRQAIDAETGLRSHVVVWEGENVSDLANAVVEPLDGDEAWARVARELPEHRLYRSAIYPEGEPLDVPAQLRKLVLETLARAPLHEPLVFLGAEEAWADPARRAALLAATATGLRDGIRQFYASQRLALSADEVERAFLGDEERPEGLG